jgi:hypothetical protein
MATLESRNYVATDADIDHLAGEMFAAQGHLDTVPRIYLRSTVATTIHELGETIRMRMGKVEKIDEAEQTRQLEAFEKVIARFYPRVVKKMSEGLPATKDRAKILNSKTNWARSAALVVRNWIRAGNSLLTLAPGRLIRATIEGAGRNTQKRAPSPARVRSRVERESKTLVTTVMELATLDKTAAIEEIQLLLGQLTGQLEELGVQPTKDAKEATSEHRPLRVGRQTFFPVTQTQVVRMQDNPS